MNLPPNLEAIRQSVHEDAKNYGLDFFDTIFELVDYDQLNEVAAYLGFPHPISALALRNGVRKARQRLYVRSIQDLRARDQQRSLLRLLDEEQQRDRSKAGHRSRIRPLRFLQEQSVVQPHQP